MTAMFPFAEPTAPSFQEMIERVRNDDAFPEKGKRDCVSSMIRTAQWVSVGGEVGRVQLPPRFRLHPAPSKPSSGRSQLNGSGSRRSARQCAQRPPPCLQAL